MLGMRRDVRGVVLITLMDGVESLAFNLTCGAGILLPRRLQPARFGRTMVARGEARLCERNPWRAGAPLPLSLLPDRWRRGESANDRGGAAPPPSPPSPIRA